MIILSVLSLFGHMCVRELCGKLSPALVWHLSLILAKKRESCCWRSNDDFPLKFSAVFHSRALLLFEFSPPARQIKFFPFFSTQTSTRMFFWIPETTLAEKRVEIDTRDSRAVRRRYFHVLLRAQWGKNRTSSSVGSKKEEHFPP